MPKRIATRRVTGGPQGDDAFVVIQRITFGQMQELLSMVSPNGKPDDLATAKANLDMAKKMLPEYVVEWNWVADEAGLEPLPQPKDNPAVFDSLLDEEVTWLMGALQGVVTEEKKASLPTT